MPRCPEVYSCCPVFKGTCCADGQHCCPLGYECVGDSCGTAAWSHPLQDKLGLAPSAKPATIAQLEVMPALPLGSPSKAGIALQ